MKAKLLMACLLSVSIQQVALAQTDALGYKTKVLTMGPNYQNQVFYKLSSEATKSIAADQWDIAFYRNSTMDMGIKVNDAKDIKVYQVSATPSAYDTVDLSQKPNWGSPLYNPDKTERLQDGAFNVATLLPQGQFNFGWGSYDMVTHKVMGKVVFVLEYADGQYYKFFINEFSSGYTFKYAKWNGNNWDATQTKTIANGSDNALFNYFSFDTGAKVMNIEPPINDWSFTLTRYYTFYNNVMMYRLSGVLQHPNLNVARLEPQTQQSTTYTLPSENEYSKMITKIGNSWKPTTGILPDVVYYIKENDQYYRLYFTENGGATTGNVGIKYKNITSELSVTDINKKMSFGLYPNPAQNKMTNLLLDTKQASKEQTTAEIYDMTGKKVFAKKIDAKMGLQTTKLDLSNLSTGTYILKVNSDGKSESKKLIIN